MPEDIYEVLALGLRYWFVLLGGLMVWRSFAWLRKDRRAQHRRLRRLPDAGMVGELVVRRGSGELPEGTVLPVPREGVLGYLRTCDLVVPVEGVASKHVDFAFEEGVGLLLRPWRGQTCRVEGEELTARSRPKENPLCHGDTLEVGEAALRLRLFAGLEATRRAALAPDEPESDGAPRAAWQEETGSPAAFSGYGPAGWPTFPEGCIPHGQHQTQRPNFAPDDRMPPVSVPAGWRMPQGVSPNMQTDGYMLQNCPTECNQDVTNDAGCRGDVMRDEQDTWMDTGQRYPVEGYILHESYEKSNPYGSANDGHTGGAPQTPGAYAPSASQGWADADLGLHAPRRRRRQQEEAPPDMLWTGRQLSPPSAEECVILDAPRGNDDFDPPEEDFAPARPRLRPSRRRERDVDA